MPGNFNGGTGGNINDPSNPWREFGFIDTSRIKEGAKEISGKAVQQAGETSWAIRLLKNQFGISDDPKKTAISFALTAATVILLAWLGNSKLSVHKMTELSFGLDDILSKSKISSTVGGFLKQGKEFITKGVKTVAPKTCANIAETFKNRPAKAKWNVMGYGDGIFGIFQNTPLGIIRNTFEKLSKEDAVMTLTKLVGNGDILDDSGKVVSSVAEDFYNIITSGGVNAAGKRFTNKETCKRLMGAIAKNFGCIGTDGKTDKRAIYEILCQLKKGNINGVNVSEFTDVLMGGDVMSSWGPANVLNMVGSGFAKLFGKEWKNIGRGNLGDALLKYGISSGEFAENKFASVMQKSILFPTETFSNFVNDKSTFGLLLCGSMMNMYNDVQDAPKEKRAGIFARHFLSSLASFVVATPFAYAATYKLATLGNLSKVKGESTIITKALKLVGNFFNMGLNKKGFIGGLSGIAGGALRFYLIQAGLAGLISNPLDKFVTKIFGEPYNPGAEALKEAQAKAQAEAMKNLNMSEEEMLKKLQAHPEIVQAIQNDDKIQKAIQQNPMILLELLASLPDTPSYDQSFYPSSILQKYINNPNNFVQPGPQQFGQGGYTAEPQRTYIPSSKPFTAGQYLS